MNDTIRSALVTVIKSNRQKMSHAQRGRGVKPQRWLYPHATEARYAATIRAWLRPMRDFVHSYLKENQEAVLRGDTAADFHTDSVTAQRLDAVPGKSFKTMVNSLSGWMAQYVPEDDETKSGSPMYMGLGKIADSTFDFNEGQFEKGAKTVLGVEFPVGEDWWPDARETWQQRNYELIHSDMKNYISQVNDLTEKAVTTGLSVKELTKQILALDSKLSKARANFIARDQIGKLNGQITQQRMEAVGLSMYIWQTAGDERVRGNPGGKYPNARTNHFEIDGALCRWDDSTVFSQDGGKTWIPRPSSWVMLHPGMDYQCRCTAIAYWQELVGEADAQIDLLEESVDNIPKSGNAGLVVMNLPKAKSTKKSVQEQQAENERIRREVNAKKAKEAADKLFPGENWTNVEDGIYLSPRRAIGKNSNYKDEKKDAQILRKFGSTVYLTPESSRHSGKKYDAIVNGLKMEFKNVGGNANTLETQFLVSRSQAPNVFINLEKSSLTRKEIMSALYGARNKLETEKSHGYDHYNKFSGGRIILKIKGQDNLVYLNVDDLKIPEQ